MEKNLKYKKRNKSMEKKVWKRILSTEKKGKYGEFKVQKKK